MIKIGKMLFNSDGLAKGSNSWLNPPKLESLQIFRNVKYYSKKYENFRKVYKYLIMRSLELNGDCKMNNSVIAQGLSISERQVIRIIKSLEELGLISCIKKTYRSDSGFKTCRMIRVWLAFYAKGCKPIYKDPVFRNDIRPGKDLETHMISKLPVTVKAYRSFMAKDKFSGQEIAIKSMKWDWEGNLVTDKYVTWEMGHHIFCMREKYEDTTGAKRREVYHYLGYSRDWLSKRNGGFTRTEKRKMWRTNRAEFNREVGLDVNEVWPSAIPHTDNFKREGKNLDRPWPPPKYGHRKIIQGSLDQNGHPIWEPIDVRWASLDITDYL